jgi:hypothetical protein
VGQSGWSGEGGLGFLRTGKLIGQGSGRNRPIGRTSPLSWATKMRRSPWAKQLCRRGRERWVVLRLATCRGGSASNPLQGCRASHSPPRLPTQSMATAMANQRRLARAGSVILVWCQGPPPRLVSLLAAFNPGAHAIPHDIGRFGRQVGENEPGVGIALFPVGKPRTAHRLLHKTIDAPTPTAAHRGNQGLEPNDPIAAQRTHLATQIELGRPPTRCQ